MPTKQVEQYTPGPWEVVQHRHIDDELWLSVNQCADAEGMKEWIAEIKYRTADETRQRADAALIAAAPDLLVALKGVLAGFEANVFCRTTEGDSDPGWAIKLLPYVVALAEATRAILKAEGRAEP